MRLGFVVLGQASSIGAGGGSRLATRPNASSRPRDRSPVLNELGRVEQALSRLVVRGLSLRCFKPVMVPCGSIPSALAANSFKTCPPGRSRGGRGRTLGPLRRRMLDELAQADLAEYVGSEPLLSVLVPPGSVALPGPKRWS